MSKKKRFFRTNIGENLEVLSDFGDKKGDKAVEVISCVKNNKVRVLSTKSMGSSEKWSEEKIFEHLNTISV